MVRASKDRHVDPVPLLEENLRSYQLMLRLAEETHAEILRGDGASFAENIAKRQQINSEISARDQIIEEARPRLTNTPIDEKITNVVKHSAATIAEIQEVDRKTLSLILEEREHLREGLARIRQGRKAAIGYGRRATHPPKFLDRRG